MGPSCRPHRGALDVPSSARDAVDYRETVPVSDLRRRHRILDGTLFRDDGTRRGHSVRCSCGWDTELSPTLAFAEASGEQHIESHRPRRSRRAEG